MKTSISAASRKLRPTRRLHLERLEDRSLMAALQVDDSFLDEIKNGPLAKAGQGAVQLVREFENWQQQAGTSEPFTSTLASSYRIEGERVEVEFVVASDFKVARRQLVLGGVKLETGSAALGLLTGMAPIGSLKALASLPDFSTLGPIVKSVIASVSVPASSADHGSGTNAGTVANQARAAHNVPALVNAYKVSGKGVKIGVLSDSVNRFGGGLKASQRTKNLPAVQIIQDGPAGSSDEGRAMLELIHDMAPAAPLAFATANIGGQAGFAKNIDRLRQAGSKVIVDDITYFAEPMFQPGVIDLAIKRAVEANIPFFSSAGNSNRGGYETSVTYNWQPGTDFFFAANDTALQVNFAQATKLTLQWDNPYNGLRNTNAITADIDLRILNQFGQVVTGSSDNNFATGIPVEIVDVQPGPHFIQLHLRSGQAPTRLKMVTFRGDTKYEYANGNSSTYGHNAGPWTIGVGAVPFYAAKPFSNKQPIRTEVFTSTGPATYLFDGVRRNRRLNFPIALPQPFVSGIDNVNNTFFGGDIRQDADRHPNFDGTSAAAPNLAAIAAMMRQKFPTATPSQIAMSMAATAAPLNGTAKGVWNPRGGYGLVNALTAMNHLRDTRLGGHIVDDGSPNFQVFGAGWRKVNLAAGTYGGDVGFHDRFLAGGTAPSAQYTFSYLKQGTYDVLARWLPRSSRATNATYSIFDGDLFEGNVVMNQTRAPVTSAFGGVAWQRLKRIVVTQGLVFVRLSASSTGNITADGMRLVYISKSLRASNGANGTAANAASPTAAPIMGLADLASSNVAPSIASNSATPTPTTNHPATTLSSAAAQDAALLLWLASSEDEERESLFQDAA